MHNTYIAYNWSHVLFYVATQYRERVLWSHTYFDMECYTFVLLVVNLYKGHLRFEEMGWYMCEFSFWSLSHM